MWSSTIQRLPAVVFDRGKQMHDVGNVPYGIRGGALVAEMLQRFSTLASFSIFYE